MPQAQDRASPRDIWDAYPSSDMLPYPRPGPRESGPAYLKRIANQPGDGLFVFLISELCSGEDDANFEVQMDRLDTALADLRAVGLAIEQLAEVAGTRQTAGRPAQ